MINWIIKNKEWIFSGIGVAIITGILSIFFKKLKLIQSIKIKKNIIHRKNITNKISSEKQIQDSQISNKNFIEEGYTILKVISESEYGTIYKVSDLHGDMYIIKKMKSGLCSITVQNKLIQIFNQHLVSPIKIWEKNGNFYEKVPYIEGWRISEILDQNDFGLDGAFLAKFIDEISDAIKMLHDSGIIHRDIHPDNIIFARESKMFKLIDCSFAIQLDVPNQIPVGRRGYSDKLQLSGKANFGTDLYSFGATLYYVVYKKSLPPFEERKSSPQTIEFPDAPERDRLPLGLNKLLSTTIEKRYESINEFLNDIKSKIPISEQNSISGMLRLPDENYILLGRLFTDYLERDSFFNFAREQTSLKPTLSMLTKDFYDYLTN